MIIRPRPSPSRFATTRFKAQTTTLWRCCLAKKQGANQFGELGTNVDDTT